MPFTTCKYCIRTSMGFICEDKYNPHYISIVDDTICNKCPRAKINEKEDTNKNSNYQNDVQKPHFGLYNTMRSKNGDQLISNYYFYFIPTIVFAHPGHNENYGGFYMGWLNYLFFIPIKWKRNKQLYLFLIPNISYSKIDKSNIISISWLGINIPITWE